MSTKAEIQAKIDLITTGGLNTAVEAVDIWQKLLDELFSADVVDNQTLETYTTKSGTDLLYDITLTKRGNLVYMAGKVRNATTSTITFANIFSWKTTPYKAKPLPSQLNFKAYYATTGNAITLIVSETGLAVKSSMSPGSFYYLFEFIIYKTED